MRLDARARLINEKFSALQRKSRLFCTTKEAIALDKGREADGANEKGWPAAPSSLENAPSSSGVSIPPAKSQSSVYVHTYSRRSTGVLWFGVFKIRVESA